MLTIFIKILLIVAVLPVLIALYVDRGRSASGSQFARWGGKNRYFWFTLIAIGILSAVEIRDYRSGSRALHEDKPLKHLELSDYTKELDALTLNDSSWPSEKQELLRKFEHAQYAYKLGGFQESLQSLVALENGKDRVGPLRQIPSYVVANNTGCVYFKIQRNKEFLASQHLILSKDRVDPGHPQWQVVEQNLGILDQMVNSLD